MGGVVIIIGARTEKLLFIGVRNKYCSICSHAEIHNVTPRDHRCFKNWRESSQAMEADIILEGFNEAERMHDLQYTKFIGDGDSFTYSTLVEKGPHWCCNLTKMECSNHACICVHSNLEALISAKPHYKRHLTKKNIIRSTSGIRCAIKRRSAESKPSVTKLQHDIRYSINHVMGHHSQCNADFCKVQQNMTASVTNIESTTSVTHAGALPPPSATSCEETEQPSSVNNIDSAINATLEDQSLYWLEGSSEAELEEARGECSDGQLPLSADLHQDVLAILERMAKKANRLL